MTVLLIGSTGMGKSTFGNYLLDPDEKHMFDNPTFIPGKDNKPMTQEVNIAKKTVRLESGKSMFLTIIDTPGLNESATKDLSHMIDIIKKLNELEEIRACILVVKFNAKIDAQYRATLEYYSKLLPGLFDKNVIIIMTEYATDARSVKLREREQINVQKIVENTIFEIGQCSNASKKGEKFSPQLFKIDCLPLDDDEIEFSRKEREAILDYIQGLLPIQLKNLTVAKTEYIQQQDAQKYERIKGEINGYKERLKEDYKNSELVLDEAHKKAMTINDIKSETKNLEKTLREINTTEDAVAAHWSINEEGRVFRWFTREFDIESPYEISNYKTWTNGKCEFKEIVQTPSKVKGKVTGKLMRGIYASVTAQKKTKYKEEITKIRRRIDREKGFLVEYEKEEEKYREEHKEKKAEIELLKKCIAERSIDAEKCLSDLMTLKEAMERLDELQNNKTVTCSRLTLL